MLSKVTKDPAKASTPLQVVPCDGVEEAEPGKGREQLRRSLVPSPAAR